MIARAKRLYRPGQFAIGRAGMGGAARFSVSRLSWVFAALMPSHFNRIAVPGAASALRRTAGARAAATATACNAGKFVHTGRQWT